MSNDLRVFVDAALSPKEQSRVIADIAQQILSDAERQNQRALGRVPEHTTIVDGRKEAAIETVKPDGMIVFEFELVLDVLGWIAGQLAIHSPVRTGQFLGSHTLLADGVEANPAKPPPAREYVFLSIDKPGKVRSLESGHSKQAPAGVYEVVAKMAHDRFSNYARISFSYHAPYKSDVRGMTGMVRRRAEKDVRVPSIIVVP